MFGWALIDPMRSASTPPCQCTAPMGDPRSATWRSSADSRAFLSCLAAACVDGGHGCRGGFGDWLMRCLVSDLAQRRRNLFPQSIPRDLLESYGDVTGEDVDF